MLNPELDPGWKGKKSAPARLVRIVWIEDCTDLVQSFKRLIRKTIPEAELIAFTNGHEAWEWLDRETPDVLISDLVHPGMGGLEMLSLLRRKNVSYPIIMFSGMMSVLGPQARRNAGPQLKVYYRAKPFLVDQFVDLLKQCLTSPLLEARLRHWSAGRPQPLRIVHLNDEPLIMEVVACLIRRCFRNVRLYQFQHSPAAWRILWEARPDLLITDDIMCGHRDWNGESIVSCLVERGVEYPILVTSGWPPTRAWVDRLEVERDKVSLLAAPYAPAEFYRELERLLVPRKQPR